MNIENKDFPAYLNIQKEIESLANRWVLAWVKFEYGYRGGAGNVRIDDDKIKFYAQYVDGVGKNCSISLKYIDDSSSLEADSIAFYKAEKAERDRKFEELERLRQTPEVKAYLALEDERRLSFFPHPYITW